MSEHTDTLRSMLEGSPYQSYAYAYPHKTAYRPLDPAPSVEQVWRDEDKRALFLYVHVPFCEMRCGFCNLFTMAKPKDDLSSRYVTALRAQAEEVKKGLGDASFARLAIGGGTPTQLEDAAFEELFDIIEDVMGADPRVIPVSCEVSPETTTPSKIAIMRERGVKRVSIGVQSFIQQETKGVRRPQPPEVLDKALTMIDEAGFELFNIDLIYGMPHQTEQSWEASLLRAMEYSPEEIFLYPLYVRPLTGLDNSKKSWDDHRMDLYNQGREFLLARGYEQHSMRMFRKKDLTDLTRGPIYCCQADGMVGLGAGARSYTRGLHYSSEYAVGRRGVVSIIEDYVARSSEQFSVIDYGFEMDEMEHRRRHVVMSVLSAEGLSPRLYKDRFGAELLDDFEHPSALVELGLARIDDGVYRLTERGLAYSDVIGPWLNSAYVSGLMREYELS